MNCPAPFFSSMFSFIPLEYIIRLSITFIIPFNSRTFQFIIHVSIPFTHHSIVFQSLRFHSISVSPFPAQFLCWMCFLQALICPPVRLDRRPTMIVIVRCPSGRRRVRADRICRRTAPSVARCLTTTAIEETHRKTTEPNPNGVEGNYYSWRHPPVYSVVPMVWISEILAIAS